MQQQICIYLLIIQNLWTFFGNNWENHAEKIKEDWIKKVKKDDTVLIPGDFSWETYLKETYKDFEFLNSLPGKKILLRGNHDYWWSTVTSINRFLKENNFNTINLLYNNSIEVENVVIAGTRGWDYNKYSDIKIIEREIHRLELSLGSTKLLNTNKPIIVCMHYPPISNQYINNEFEKKIINLLNEYNVKLCLYGHLHGNSHAGAIIGKRDDIEYKLVSADYLGFKLLKIM